MAIVMVMLRMAGGLCLFLYGMKIMSDGIQQAAGDRLQRVLNFMTGNRFIAVITGAAVTALVQSSSAATVMIVSFVNAGLLTLTQSIGVIMGANIGTTTTAWIVSLIGFRFDISAIALPAVGVGFTMGVIKWKHHQWGEVFLGFGFIFLGLRFLNDSMPSVTPDALAFIRGVSNLGFLSVLICVAAGTVLTLIMHSSAAMITLTIALSYRNVVTYEMAVSMTMGANIGTTIDAILAAMGAKTAAKRTALVHVLFNVGGSVLALIFFRPLLNLVDLLSPGLPAGAGITIHLAMFHTVFNILGTVLFLPFVRQFAALVSFIIKDDKTEEAPGHYRLVFRPASLQDTPGLDIIRAEKEIRDMAAVASSMYAAISAVLRDLLGTEDKEGMVNALVESMKQKEAYADEMREALTAFLIECTGDHLNQRTRRRISLLIRITADLEDMTDDCFSICLLLERSVRKNRIFKGKEMKALAPYAGMVEQFLSMVGDRLGRRVNAEEAAWAKDLEDKIDRSRNKLRKLGRKRIEAGKDVKTELLFIDLVRRIEKLGDYCYGITEALASISVDTPSH
ncbi:MAG: Na/Pi cotransporter family protein [Treponema sp.]|jgi:phosphate:Na+ symporter|nr:Na/Pi cotransporter family protein [Treponema sp.]